MLRQNTRQEQEGTKKTGTARVTFGLDPPEGPSPPPTPTHYLYQGKKGTILLLFKSYIRLHTYYDLKLKRCRVLGQKLRCGRPCTHILPGTHNWLAHPHNASNSFKFH